MNKEIMLQEIESLARSMDFIQEEQAFIKRKLSSLLENIVMHDFIEWAEDLQLQIINRETAIKLLNSDIVVLRNKAKANKSINNIVEAALKLDFKKYKKQVVYLENEFMIWKNDVNERFEATPN
jgi:16S rRNA C1402 (ribose-2'-O) methylase RsmI